MSRDAENRRGESVGFAVGQCSDLQRGLVGVQEPAVQDNPL